MADESNDPPRGGRPEDGREEHRRRNEEQAELLRKAYDRWRHASYIEEALRRRQREPDGENGSPQSGC
jgi:hypothetical protein